MPSAWAIAVGPSNLTPRGFRTGCRQRSVWMGRLSRLRDPVWASPFGPPPPALRFAWCFARLLPAADAYPERISFLGKSRINPASCGR